MVKKYLPNFLSGAWKDVDQKKVAKELARQEGALTTEEKLDLTRAELLPKARKVANRIPFVKDLVAGYYCMMDTQTPVATRATILAPLVYFVVPVDAVPDFILGAGYADDTLVWLGAMKLFSSSIKASHYDLAEKALAEEIETVPPSGEK